MTKSSSSSGKTPPDPRKARLARALRDNLRRRKEQARDRQADRKVAGRDGGDSPEVGSTADGPGPNRRS